MKKFSRLGKILSKNEKRKIKGGSGDSHCCQLPANSCGQGAQTIQNCTCSEGNWSCSDDWTNCRTISC